MKWPVEIRPRIFMSWRDEPTAADASIRLKLLLHQGAVTPYSQASASSTGPPGHVPAALTRCAPLRRSRPSGGRLHLVLLKARTREQQRFDDQRHDIGRADHL